MSTNSKIEWTEKTWNPIAAFTKKSDNGADAPLGIRRRRATVFQDPQMRSDRGRAHGCNGMSIRCPHCGEEIELEARPKQAELPLGPIETNYGKKRLDNENPVLVNSVATSLKPLKDPLRDKDIKAFKGAMLAPKNKGSLPREREEQILRVISEIIGERAMKKNGGGWRVRIRQHTKAVCYAIEAFEVRGFDQQMLIANRDNWLADKFFRAKQEIEEAEVKCQHG